MTDTHPSVTWWGHSTMWLADSGVRLLTDPVLTDRPVIRPSDEALEKAVQLIAGAKKIAIHGGEGTRNARDEVLRLSETLQAPISFAYRGKDVLEADNPSGVGMTGLLGWGGATEALAECDLLLMLGTDFPYKQFLPTSCKIAQVDIRPEQLGRRAKLDLGLVGDVGATLAALLPRLRPDGRGVGSGGGAVGQRRGRRERVP